MYGIAVRCSGADRSVQCQGMVVESGPQPEEPRQVSQDDLGTAGFQVPLLPEDQVGVRPQAEKDSLVPDQAMFRYSEKPACLQKLALQEVVLGDTARILGACEDDHCSLCVQHCIRSADRDREGSHC